jgi:transposase-like protein
MADDQALSIIKIAERVPTEAAAYEFLEQLRWHGEPVCPHCGSINEHYFLKPRNGVTRETNRGSQTQRRLWKCKDCRGQFSVLTGTIMQGTHIKIRTWIFVFFEMVANKNGLAAREVERKYELSPKSAWFLLHRVREAMKREPAAGLLAGVIVADETWIGGKPKNKHQQGKPRPGSSRYASGTPKHMVPVLSLVNTTTGEVRSQVVADVGRDSLRRVINEQVNAPESVLHTDGHKAYRQIGATFQSHEWVDHEHREYVRGEVSTNAAEGYFSQLKRSIDGTHHHVSRTHLPRYLAEFDFRYSTCDETDTARMARLMGQVAGRRLTFRPLTDES